MILGKPLLGLRVEKKPAKEDLLEYWIWQKGRVELGSEIGALERKDWLEKGRAFPGSGWLIGDFMDIGGKKRGVGG